METVNKITALIFIRDKKEWRLATVQEITEILRNNGVTIATDTNDKWVSVDERLPEEEGKYIVCTAKNTVYCAKYHAKGKFFGTDMHTHITHWMPLPQPPKGVQ